MCERKRRRKNRETSREEDPVIHYIFRAYNIDIPPKWARDRRGNEIKFGERVQWEAVGRRGETEEGRRASGQENEKEVTSNSTAAEYTSVLPPVKVRGMKKVTTAITLYREIYVRVSPFVN